MYDMTKFSAKYWEVKFIDGNVLHIAAINVETYGKLIMMLNSLTNPNETAYENLLECVYLIINDNKEKIVYDKETLRKLLSQELQMEFVNNYTDWLIKEVEEKN